MTLNSSNLSDGETQIVDNEEHLQHNVWGYYYGYYYQVYHLVALIFCTTGLLTNLINMVVFTRPAMRNSTNFLLTSIAFADILIVLVRGSRSVAYYLCPTIHDYVNVYTAMYAYGMYTFEYTSLLMSEWLSVTLGAWRFIAVKWPFRAKTWCSTGRAKLSLIIITTSSLFVSLPCLYMVDFKQQNFRGLPINLLTPRTIHGIKFGVPHDSYLAILCVSVTVPILFLMMVTVGLIWHTWRAKKFRRGLSVVIPADDDVKTQRTTVMLTVVLVTFIVANVPSTILTVACLIPQYSLKFSITAYNNLFQSIFVIGNTTTFITYFFMSSKYRETFLGLFNKGRSRDELSNVSAETTTTLER